MSQHDFNIANQSFPATRTDLNNALQALASNSSGDAEPSTTFANQWWYETDTNTLKLRNEANNAWLSFATVDQTTGAWTLAHDVDITGTLTSDGLTVDKGSAGTLATFTDGVNSNFVIETSSLLTTIGNGGGSAALAFKSNNTTNMTLAASGNLGIGTSSPSVTLHVKSANPVFGLETTGTVSAGSAVYSELKDSTGTVFVSGFAGLANCYQFGTTAAAGFMRFLTGAQVEALRIDASGNVGIGTTSPTARLQLSSTGNPALVFDGTNQGTNLKRIRIVTQVAAAGDFAIQSMNDAGSVKRTNLYINSSGNVGIGTSSPSTQGLHILSSAGVGAISQPYATLNIENSTGDPMMIMSGISGGIIASMNNSQAATPLRFYTGQTERMRIDSSGNVLVGTTSNIAAGAKIFAQGTGVGIAVGYGTGSAEYRHMYMNSGDGSLFFFNPTNYASLSAAGAWTNASDARLKKDIVDIKYGLAEVLLTQPRSYKMNNVEGDFVGFIAQELQPVIPEVVSGDPEKQLGVDYGSLVAVAFKAIQEQQAIITAMEIRLSALEG